LIRRQIKNHLLIIDLHITFDLKMDNIRMATIKLAAYSSKDRKPIKPVDPILADTAEFKLFRERANLQKKEFSTIGFIVRRGQKVGDVYHDGRSWMGPQPSAIQRKRNDLEANRGRFGDIKSIIAAIELKLEKDKGMEQEEPKDIAEKCGIYDDDVFEEHQSSTTVEANNSMNEDKLNDSVDDSITEG
jgi:hypothetical protein